MAPLVAIEYKRGALRLLEQRKLPLETAWVDVGSCEEAWAAIRDMTVRGAPAIAISAALALAVELVNARGGGGSFASAAAAADYIAGRLDYLVTRSGTVEEGLRGSSRAGSSHWVEACAPGRASENLHAGIYSLHCRPSLANLMAAGLTSTNTPAPALQPPHRGQPVGRSAAPDQAGAAGSGGARRYPSGGQAGYGGARQRTANEKERQR